MSKYCFITGKKTIFGNKRSYSMSKSKRKFIPNIHYHKFWSEEKKRFIRLRLTTKAIRCIDKNGLECFIKNKKEFK